jgi:hypothetical protein
MQKVALSPLATRLLTGGAIGTASGAALGGALAPENEALNYALMGGVGGLGAGLLAGGGYHLSNRPASLGGPVRSAPTPGKTPAPPAGAKPPRPFSRSSRLFLSALNETAAQ